MISYGWPDISLRRTLGYTPVQRTPPSLPWRRASGMYPKAGRFPVAAAGADPFRAGAESGDSGEFRTA